jgi:hypothetical protein
MPDTGRISTRQFGYNIFVHDDPLRIVAVDILPKGLLVTFNDQRAALFNPELLQSVRTAAEELLHAELLNVAIKQLQEELAERAN